MFKNKVSMPVVASSGGGGYKIEKLTITKNGLYDSEFEAYKPVYVDVPQISEDGTLLKNVLDATKSASYLFKGYKGTSVDNLIEFNDTHNVTSFNETFSNCDKLTSIPRLDTSNAESMHQMFTGCNILTSIPDLDTSKVVSFYYCLSGCTSLTSIGMYGFTRSINISQTALEHDAIIAFLNQAGTAYDSSQKITMGADKLALLSDEEKAIATNKGWTLA